MTRMATSTAPMTSSLLPRTDTAPGELLWGDAPQRQPIAPLILMAVILLLVAAPTALGGSGGSGNPISIMRDVADSTYTLTGLMKQSNKSLHQIDEHSALLGGMQGSMAAINEGTVGMQSKTEQLNGTLAKVGAAVEQSGEKLETTDAQLAATAKSMGSLRANVTSSAASTDAIVKEFALMDTAIGSMDANLKKAITKMAASGPLTKEFANNRTRVAISGGATKKYGVPNLAPDTRVMSVVLPMITMMQKGGALPARKDRHEASNPIVGMALRMQVPDNTNVVAIVQPFDGFYGLPGEDFFVQNRIHGF